MKRRSSQRFALMGSLFALVAAGCSSSSTTTTSATTTAASVPVATSATTVAATATGAATTAAAPTTAGSTATSGSASASASTAAGTTTAGATGTVPANLHKGGTLKLAIDGEAGCYVPSLCTVSYGPGAVRGGVLEDLVKPAQNADGYELQLADSITPNSDFTQFTVKLKAGVVYSDGTPLTAGDIKKLFDTYVLGAKSALKGNVAIIASTDAPDDQTVVFHLSAPTSPFPALLSIIPIWKPVDNQTQTTLPIGTGPFMFQSFEPNVATKLVRNPHYRGKDSAGNQLPYLDEIDITAVTSGDTRVNSIQSGGVDLTMSTDPLVTASLGKVSKVSQLPLNAGGGIFINTSAAPTDDVRVREALAYATNKQDIIDAIGGGEVRDEYWVKSSPWYSKDASAATPSFDVAKAKDFLAQYVNDPNRSDKKPAGTPLELKLDHVQGAITQESIAALAQQQWGDIGIKVTIAPEDQSTLIGDAISGNYQTTYFGWATPSPYSLLTHNYGPPKTTPTNFTHFDNADLTKVIADMAVAKSVDDSNTLIAQSNMIFAKQLPVIFLHSTTIGWAAGKNVGNLQLGQGDGIVDFSTLSVVG